MKMEEKSIEKNNFERQPAVKCSIKHILESEYYELPGWEPNFILIQKKLKANRVNVIGVIIDKSEEFGFKTFILEDNTGKILLRSFEEQNFNVNIGDVVLVIGKPRKYNDSFYILPEIIKSIDKKWIEYRLKELEFLEEKLVLMEEIKVEDTNEKIIEENVEKKVLGETTIEEYKQKNNNINEFVEEKSDSEIIYDLIRENDTGDGADMFLILKLAEEKGIKNAEKNIRLMLELGDIFEIKAGKLKVL